MSDNVPLDRSEADASLSTLTRLVRHLGEELAGFRRRALTAEARVKALEAQAASGGLSPERSQALERENQELHARLDVAQQRTAALLERVRFLRQQHDLTSENPGGKGDVRDQTASPTSGSVKAGREPSGDQSRSSSRVVSGDNNDSASVTSRPEAQ